MNSLSGLDAAFFYLEQAGAPMHLGSLALYEQPGEPVGLTTAARVRQNVAARLHLARCFRRRVARVPLDAGHPYWIEDADFDLDAHIDRLMLPRPGTWLQLCQEVGRFHARPLDPSRALWEMLVIEGLEESASTPKGCFAIATKVHHAAIDGVSGVELIAALHDLAPEDEPGPPLELWRPERSPWGFELLARAAAASLQRPAMLSSALVRSVSSAVRFSRRLVAGESGAASWAPRTRFNAPVSADRVFDARTFDLDRICEIKKSVAGATVNDVVLSVCGGALRKYLEAKGELPDASLVAMAPISIRSPSQEGAGGNRLSQMAVALRSDVADAGERLRRVAQGTARSKDTTTASGEQLLADCAELVPGSLLRLAVGATAKLGLAGRMNRLCNTVITNMRGPAVPIYSSGARLRSFYGFGPILDGMGLIQTVFSYCGTLTISFTSCREMLPDPDFYGACLDDAFRELEDAVFGEAPARRSGAEATG